LGVSCQRKKYPWLLDGGQGKPKDQPILRFWGMFFLDVLNTTKDGIKLGINGFGFFDVFCLCIVRQIPVAGCCIK
jgi:hypothetical protein